jgi:hypothetical protein
MIVEESNLGVQICGASQSPGAARCWAGVDRYRAARRISPAGATPPPAVAQLAAPAPALPMLAILPFQNISGEFEQQYFADGMVDLAVPLLTISTCGSIGTLYHRR